MGAGKSTVGRELAARLGKTFVETDILVERRAGMSVSDVFARHGEAHFRDMESAVVREAAKSRDCVIACGGGVVLREENVAALKASSVMVYLEVAPQSVLSRIGPQSAVRPLLSGPDRERRVAELMEQRRSAYEAAADVIVATDGLAVEEVVRHVQELLTRL
jgi:shikimate kinase